MPDRIRWDNQPAPEGEPAPQQRPAPRSRSRPAAQPVQPPRRSTPLLDQVGRDLTRLAREGRLAPLFGREKELLQLQRILLRKQKSNPILTGAPGVGKTALVEGLAQRIARGEAAAELNPARIVEISTAALVAGTVYRGSFEARLQALLDEVRGDPLLIIFFDEIHTLVRAGAIGDGALDAANMLKPALARGEIRCIGSTTADEFDRFIQSDPAFERRFEPLVLEEPGESEAVEMLQAARPGYEQHHGLAILPEAVQAAVRLSVQHLPERRLPDKAFDLLDSACTLARLPGAGADQPAAVDAACVARALAEKIKVPVEKLDQDLREKLTGLEETLNRQVVGQPEALRRISAAVLGGYAGLNRPGGPRCVFAFFGASGVGKTAAARALAEAVFGSPDALIRLDMAEFQEPHTVSRLLGAPPGYIGYDDEGSFATRLRRQPFSIVLLDEFEKCHAQVQEAFLNLFDDGRLVDARGRIVDARGAIFILTSNLFTMGEVPAGEDYEAHAAAIRQSLSGYFRPELVNRIQEIVLFGELSPADLAEIARLEIAALNARLEKFQVSVQVDPAALAWIGEQARDPNSGARAVLRLVQKEITAPLSSALARGEVPPGGVVRITLEKGLLRIRWGETTDG